MSYGIPSDEVAEDYRKALEDLTMNSRYEISNLTVIAKENTEHALAISEALKNHIKQTAPQKKLPAFYVLDSVVKNVGTPYTLFFGRQLYSTFMEAYALVDNNVRTKMMEMLRTWKEPVPGSMDSRPVFPPEVTRPIENALLKAKTSYLQAHQELSRNQPNILGRGRPTSATPYRETSTPPNVYRQPPPPTQGYPSNYAQQPQQQYQAPMNTNQYPPQQAPPVMNGPQYGNQQMQSGINGSQYPNQQSHTPMNGTQYPNQYNGNQKYSLPPRPVPQQYPPPPQNQHWQQPPLAQHQQQVYGATEDSVGALNRDIENLITAAKAEWSQNSLDNSIGTRLKALLDLQTILQNQKLPPDQIALIKDQVEKLSRVSQPTPQLQPLPTHLPPKPVHTLQAPTPQPSLSSILGPGALAALLARQSATPHQNTPPPPASVIRSPQQQKSQPTYQQPPSVMPAATPVPDAGSLLERLRAAGMLPAVPASTSTPTPGSLPQGFPMPPFLSTPPSAARTPLASIPNDVVLKPASLKLPRPHLLASLYEKLGTPCTQCGRRFQSDEQGKKKKAAHMDWHFHVRQRMDEAETRGQHRSWYVDELDWIKSREVDGESGATIDASQGSTSSAATNLPKVQYLPVPDDPALANSVCPICQEKFEMKWLDEAQEFVWMDAKKVADRIYHASCYAEATKDVNTQAKRGTPEPVLGKRKAEDDHMAMRAKIKSEPAS